MSLRKVGGIHFLAIGRLRFSFCVTKPKHVPQSDDVALAMSHVPYWIYC